MNNKIVRGVKTEEDAENEEEKESPPPEQAKKVRTNDSEVRKD